MLFKLLIIQNSVGQVNNNPTYFQDTRFTAFQKDFCDLSNRYQKNFSNTILKDMYM